MFDLLDFLSNVSLNGSPKVVLHFFANEFSQLHCFGLHVLVDERLIPIVEDDVAAAPKEVKDTAGGLL